MNGRKILQVLALMVAPVMAGVGCGGVDDIFGSDGGTNNNVCPTGTTLYSIGGNYATVVASNIQDGCNEGLQASNLQAARTIVYDVQSGAATVTSTNSGTQLGTGSVRCNKGMLVYGPATIENSSCRWTTDRTVDFVATGNYQVTLAVTDNRSSTQQVANGPQCGQPASCTTRFTLTMSK